MAPLTPSTKPTHTPAKTPHSRHRLQFTPSRNLHPSMNPSSAAKESVPTEHPVEIIGRIRDYPDRKEKPCSALEISSDGQSVRVRTDIGYRNFSIDGVSVSEEEGLDGFYKRFIESRISSVRLGDKCTIMMYGPTGSGKSHTMFGCPKNPGIVYRALRDILGGGGGDEEEKENRDFGSGLFVHVTVLEIYNEEIYDLLSTSNGGGFSLGFPKGSTPKVRLEVMGKKAKNAAYLSGKDPGKISKEVAKVEKRRIVKSTLCNERSSRSHCLIILDVPSVGGRLMLVDMAGSENIEQAGQTGAEAKMQTAKINQGNIALKRVVESIANGDSHVPFRDSKLTMLLQDSFEDDKSKILMILCASPDPKEMHKTISTFEYGAKAKCIVRSSHMPNAKVGGDESIVLGSRIAAMDQFIYKLQLDNKLKEKERDEARNELLRKEKEVAELRAKLELLEGRGQIADEQLINSKVNEKTRMMSLELEKLSRMASEMVEMKGRKMEEEIFQKVGEFDMLRRRLEEIESSFLQGNEQNGKDTLEDLYGGRFVNKLSEIYGEGDIGMEKSMDLDMGDQPPIHEVKEIKEDICQLENSRNNLFSNIQTWCNSHASDLAREESTVVPEFVEKVSLSTVFEDDEEGEDLDTDEGEVDREIGVDKAVHLGSVGGNIFGSEFTDTPENSKDAVTARKTRIQNIFMLCGNYRELAQQVGSPAPTKKKTETATFWSSPVALKENIFSPNMIEKENTNSDLLEPFTSLHLGDEKRSPGLNQLGITESQKEYKENSRLGNEATDDMIDVYVKWEASKDFSGKLVMKLQVGSCSSLADLRKVIETCLTRDNNKQAFTFLMLGDPTGAPVARDKESSVQVIKLPICNNQLNGHLACLRPSHKPVDHVPFSSLENKLRPVSYSPSAISKDIENSSPRIGENLSYSYLTGLRV
ncbi:Kinesin-1 [Acorus calamus]|uniref:Kinesin-like protein KIN-10A n=1 Tax=Acorus calamus TaxID=4465 RepID=A0AAV9C456_ACOCL|nr:Kinesin-1 [Acorus calamus]